MVSKELDLLTIEFEQAVKGLANIFLQRQDIYARQLEDGRYICIQKPMPLRFLRAHLQGDLTLGVYVLNRESHTRFLVFDADDCQRMVRLIEMARELARQDTIAYLEDSRRGGHLWLFFSQALPGQQVREFGAGLKEKFGLKDVEMFPKQDQLHGGPGSLIRLPFGIHRRTGQRYGFYSVDLEPIAPSFLGQIQFLCSPQTVPPELFEAYQVHRPIQDQVVVGPKKPRKSPEGYTLSERIKQRISVRDFVGQYVELSPSGLGRCPFHEDSKPSFSVNLEGNYWHCFAGCGGGSLIDFWMKWRKCNFNTAVRELARMLL